MPKSHRPYPPAFRRQMIELVRRGRTPEQLSREFEPSAQAIRNCRRPPRRLRLHRRLVQSAAAAFGARLSVTDDVRAVARNPRSLSALRIDDRPGGCYLDIPSVVVP